MIAEIAMIAANITSFDLMIAPLESLIAFLFESMYPLKFPTMKPTTINIVPIAPIVYKCL